MKKGIWVIIIIVVLVLGVVAYLNKHALKLLFTGGGSTTPATSLYQAPTTGTTTTTTTTGSIIQTKTDPAKGAYLAAANGMSLYVFDKDTTGVSNCTGGCLTVWPAYAAASTTGTLPTNLSVITRADGTLQYAYSGKPLYYYASDAKVGDTLGDGVNGIWHLAKP